MNRSNLLLPPSLRPPKLDPKPAHVQARGEHRRMHWYCNSHPLPVHVSLQHECLSCAQHKGPGCMHPSVGSANKDASNDADTPWLQHEALHCNRWKRLTGTSRLGRLRQCWASWLLLTWLGPLHASLLHGPANLLAPAHDKHRCKRTHQRQSRQHADHNSRDRAASQTLAAVLPARRYDALSVACSLLKSPHSITACSVPAG